jgi:hypothetical protein
MKSGVNSSCFLSTPSIDLIAKGILSLSTLNNKKVLTPEERLNLLQTLTAKNQVICGMDVYSAMKTIKKVKTMKVKQTRLKKKFPQKFPLQKNAILLYCKLIFFLKSFLARFFFLW